MSNAPPALEREAMSDPQPYPVEQGQLETEQEEQEPPDIAPPPHLKDIGQLASWTVSTYKPGCGVGALRDPNMERYWQSDGPQPHYLNIHFFKLVSISHLRFYIDSKFDESYTPTKMQFLAGTGHHDLQTVCEMDLPEVIRGWTEVDLKHAGGPPALKENEYIEDDDEYDDTELMNMMASQREEILERRKWKRIGTGPTLRCFLLQVRILENHQNGKDTHLRGLQLFARDESYVFTRRKGLPLRSSPNGDRDFLNDVNAGLADDMTTGRVTRARSARKARASDAVAAALASSTITSPEASIPMNNDHAMAELEMRFGEPELR